jgi:DNA-binding NarL/FixJ family response regulator
MLAEQLATRAVLEASLSHTESARAHAEAAGRYTGCAEVDYLARFATAICEIHERPGEESDEQATELLLDAEVHGILDTAVIAYRAHPPLLKLWASDSRTSKSVAQMCQRANDGKLAKEAGIDLRQTPSTVGALECLTRREREVLDLMCDGLGNGEIARRLFIAEGTAKVHVQHVLAKLGARSRLQAVLAARDALGY